MAAFAPFGGLVVHLHAGMARRYADASVQLHDPGATHGEPIAYRVRRCGAELSVSIARRRGTRRDRATSVDVAADGQLGTRAWHRSRGRAAEHSGERVTRALARESLECRHQRGAADSSDVQSGRERDLARARSEE